MLIENRKGGVYHSSTAFSYIGFETKKFSEYTVKDKQRIREIISHKMV